MKINMRRVIEKIWREPPVFEFGGEVNDPLQSTGGRDIAVL